MQRRGFLATSMAALALPAAVRAQSQTTFRFIPQIDLAFLDPHWTTAYVTRNHGYMVFDTLFGQDGSFKYSPQMLEGYTVDTDGKQWNLTLREGLLWHDGEKVLARDCVASIKRWGQRDALGGALMAATDELSAVDDRTIRFRMKKRFPVSRALTNSALIMPARLAQTDAATQITEMVGSGPFRFLANERVAGAFVAYAKFENYLPRPDGAPSATAGPKIAHVDRVEWHVIPDPGTAAAAMLAGEMDWWETQPDFLPKLRASSRLRLETLDTLGGIRIMRFNHLQPPFDNPAMRRALLHVVKQSDVMKAAAGDDHSLWRDGVGVFTPGTPMANDAGIDLLMGPRDAARAKAELAAAGYNGEKIVVMNPADQPGVYSDTLVGADMAAQAGFNVDMQTMDWGTLLQRRAKTVPPSEGGWNMVFTGLSGSGCMDPSSHIALRGNGIKAWAGWPTSPRIEALRENWFDAPDVAAQQAICIDIQRQFWVDLPYIPLGQRFGPVAVNNRVTDVPKGFPLFYGLKIT